MGLDLTKLNEIVKVADQAGNKDGKVNVENEKEVSVFEAELAKLGLTKEEEQSVYSLMGLEKSEEVKSSAPEKLSRKERKAAKKEQGGREDLTTAQLRNVVAVGLKEGETIVGNLNARLGGNASDPEYKKLVAEVQTVMNAIPAYNSKADVEAIHDKAEKALKKADKWDDFHKEVLDALEAHAEKTQKAKEYAEIQKSFTDKYNKGNATLEDVMKEVKAEYKDKGSYYSEILSNGNFGNRIARALTFRGKKLNEFEKTYVMNNARELVKDNISESDSKKSKAVKKDAKAGLKEDGDYDKYTKRALRGENNFHQWVTGEDSNMKIARKNQARYNTVESAKSQTKEAILDALGKNKYKLFDALEGSGLITKKADGTYDLSILSDTILNEVGSDRYLDKSNKKFKPISEKLGTFTELAEKAGLKGELSDKEAKKLVELCGFEIEGKDWKKVIWRTTLGGVLGALSAGGAEAMRENKAHSYKNQDEIQNNIYIDTDNLDDLKFTTIINGEEVPSEKPIINITMPDDAAASARVILDMTTNIKNLKDLLVQGGKFVMSNALKGAVIGAAVGFLDGILDDSKTETPIAEINFDCMTLQEYIDRVEAKFPEWSGALTQIAMTFNDKDGNWDCDGFKAFLRKAAGNDILNRKELIAALKDRQKELDKPETTPTTTPVTTPSTTTPVGGEQQTTVTTTPEKCPVDMKETVGKKAVVHNIKFGDSWEELVEAYFPTWKECFGKLQGKDGAVRALKKALATKADGTLDNATYQKLLAGYIPSSISVPEQIGDCKRDGDVVKALKFRNPEGAPEGYMGSVGIQTNTDGEVTLTDCKGRSGNGKNVEEAISNLNSKLEKGETPYKESDITRPQ